MTDTAEQKRSKRKPVRRPRKNQPISKETADAIAWLLSMKP